MTGPEPERWGVWFDRYESALRKARAEIASFEHREQLVRAMDDDFLADAKGDRGIAAMNRDKSPIRKRAIDACQFAIQKANMYSAYAAAIAVGHLHG